MNICFRTIHKVSHLSFMSFSVIFYIKNSMCILQACLGFPGGASGKEPVFQCREHKRWVFDPWSGKIPWRRAWQPTPVFLPGESPWTEKPGGLQFMGSQRVRHDWASEREVWSHCGFNVYFPNDSWCQPSFQVFLASTLYQESVKTTAIPPWSHWISSDLQS